jgi:hypothetical protein
LLHRVKPFRYSKALWVSLENTRVLLFVLFCAEIEDVVGYGTSPAMENDNPTAWRFDFKFFINISRTTTDKDRAALGAQAQKGQ